LPAASSRSTMLRNVLSLHPALSNGTAETIGGVEARLLEVSRRAPDRLREPVFEALSAGGKRLRPLLVVLSARMGVPEESVLVRAAAAVEVLHTATLIHDDIVDRAASRRGRPTTVAGYGRETAVAVGDFLFAEAFGELAAVGDPRLVRVMAEAAAELASGELKQFRASGELLDVDAYMEHIRMKTAGLFRAACVAGGTLGGLSLRQVDSLATYGQSLGVAFQMTDDVIDLVGKPGRMGKDVGSDLAEGTVTLPIIFALQEGDGEAIRRVLLDPDPAPEDLAAAIAAVRATSAIERTESRARDEVESAISGLTELPDTPERRILEAIASKVVGRDA
jgi:geranylgeranyl pyrophosphate synthase